MASTVTALHREYLAHIEEGERLGEAQERLLDERGTNAAAREKKSDVLQQEMLRHYDLAAEAQQKIAKLPALGASEILIKLQHSAGEELTAGVSRTLLESAIHDLEVLSGVSTRVPMSPPI